MKYLVVLLLIIIGLGAKAQFPSQAVPTQYSTGWFRQGWPQADSGTILATRSPNFTPRFPATLIHYQQAGVDSSLYYWNGGRWVKLLTTVAPVAVTWGSIGGTLSDQSDLQSALNLKLNTSDTSNKWVNNIRRLPGSLNVEIYKNGSWTTAYQDSVPTVGAGTVTSVALSMPSAFSVSGSPITTNGTLNVSGAGSTLQYIRGNGTLATADSGMIPNFYLKVRSLLSGTSPITYNSTTGAIGIPYGNAAGTRGAVSFNNGSFSDNGSGLISLNQPVAPGACTNCDITWGVDGRPTAYSNGSGGSGAGVDTMYRVPGVDSIYYKINNIQRAIKDSVGGAVSDTVFSTYVAYVDTLGNDATAVVNNPAKPFATINAALDATASFQVRVIDIGVGHFDSPDSAKVLSYTWFRGHGKPKPNWVVAVPSIDGDTKTDPTALIGGTILNGSFFIKTSRLQNIIATDFGVDVGSDWCTANNSGNPAEGFLCLTDYDPGHGNAADGGHFLQSSVTPLQGLVVRNVASLCQSADALVHAALFENCLAPDIFGVSTYFGVHGIVFKTIGGVAGNLEAFGHGFDGIIVKSNDYANCYRLSISNFNIGSIGVYDGAGLILDDNDTGAPGLYFCTISNGTINRTTFGIRAEGAIIDGNNISNVLINVAQVNGVELLTGFGLGGIENITTRSCGGVGFNITSGEAGITINDCNAYSGGSDGFRFTGSNNVNFDNINAISNSTIGINVLSGSVYGGIKYAASNGGGSTAGTIISKISLSLQQVTDIGATTTNAVTISGYSTTANKFRVGDFALQPYGLNNGFITDNAQFNGSWQRFNTGYASKIQFFNGQVMISSANTGSGSPTWIQGIKTDFNGHVGLGGNIDDVTYSGAKVFIDGSSGNTLIGSLSDNGYKLQVNGAVSTVTDSATAINMAWIDTDGKIRKSAIPSGATTIYSGSGTLAGDRNVSSGGFTLRFAGANNTDTLVSIINSGTTSVGLFASGTAVGINIVSSGTGLQSFGSTRGAIITGDTDEGLLVKSNAVRGARIQTVPSSTNTVVEVLQLERGVSGGAGADGIGEYISFLNKTSDLSSSECNTIISKFTNATTATRTSQLSITGVNSGSTVTLMTLDGNGNATFGTTNSIVGTATNNNAVAGNIGEEINSTVSTYANYTTTATYQNIASITLTAGDWDLSAFFTYSSNSATITAAANAIFAISTTTASASGATEGLNINYVPQAALLGTSKFSDAIPSYRVSLSGTTTYYLNTQATFTLGNPQYVGSLRARRCR